MDDPRPASIHSLLRRDPAPAEPVKARAAHRPSDVTLMMANINVTVHGPIQNGRCRCSGGIFAEIIAPSGSAIPIVWVSSPCGSGKIR